jgi:Protein of unknown function (DUF2934)
MANRRVSDSQKSSKSTRSGAAPVAAPPLVNAAVHAGLDAAGAAQSAPAAKPRKRRAAAKPDQALITATATPAVTEDQRRGMIALSAYLRAERRGFSPDGQAEDWLAAEKEVDALLNSGQTAPQ